MLSRELEASRHVLPGFLESIRRSSSVTHNSSILLTTHEVGVSGDLLIPDLGLLGVRLEAVDSQALAEEVIVVRESAAE